MKKLILFLLLLCIAFPIASCKDETEGTYKYFLTISHAEYTMEKGDKFTLKATYSDNKSNVTFISDNQSVATVNENGTITAISSGECYIIAKVDGKEKSCKITVIEPSYVIELVYTDVKNIIVGAKVNIAAILYKDGVRTDGNLIWQITPNSGCTIETMGNSAVFTALVAGEYTIIVSSGKCSNQCVLTAISAT
jgi:uncharacterized protein YjdB